TQSEVVQIHLGEDRLEPREERIHGERRRQTVESAAHLVHGLRSWRGLRWRARACARARASACACSCASPSRTGCRRRSGTCAKATQIELGELVDGLDHLEGLGQLPPEVVVEALEPVDAGSEVAGDGRDVGRQRALERIEAGSESARYV